MYQTLALLDSGPWIPEETAERTFTASPVTIVAGDDPAKPDAAVPRPRFVRIQAHDGDLLVTIGTSTDVPGNPTSGSLRVFEGTAGIFRTPVLSATGKSVTIKVAAVTGSVKGSVLWGA